MSFVSVHGLTALIKKSVSRRVHLFRCVTNVYLMRAVCVQCDRSDVLIGSNVLCLRKLGTRDRLDMNTSFTQMFRHAWCNQKDFHRLSMDLSCAITHQYTVR